MENKKLTAEQTKNLFRLTTFNGNKHLPVDAVLLQLLKDHADFCMPIFTDGRDWEMHVRCGLGDEIGELHNVFKKYSRGMDLDLDNLKEELGDVLFYSLIVLQKYKEWPIGLSVAFGETSVESDGYLGYMEHASWTSLKQWDTGQVQVEERHLAHIWTTDGGVLHEVSGILTMYELYGPAILSKVFLAIACSPFTVEEVVAHNKKKLSARYPQGYTIDADINRDLNKEKDATNN